MFRPTNHKRVQLYQTIRGHFPYLIDSPNATFGEPTKVKSNKIYPKCNYIWADVITFAKLQPTKHEGVKCNYIQM